MSAVADRSTRGDGDGGADAHAVTEREGRIGQETLGQRMANGAVPNGGTGGDTDVDPDTHVLSYVAVRIERAMRTDDRPRIDDRMGADNGSRTHTHARHDDGAVLEPDAVRQGCRGTYDTKRAYTDAGTDDRVSTDVDTRSKAGGDADQSPLADDDVGPDPSIVSNESGGVNTRGIPTRTRTGSTGTGRGGRDNRHLHTENANRKCCPKRGPEKQARVAVRDPPRCRQLPDLTLVDARLHLEVEVRQLADRREVGDRSGLERGCRWCSDGRSAVEATAEVLARDW